MISFYAGRIIQGYGETEMFRLISLSRKSEALTGNAVCLGAGGLIAIKDSARGIITGGRSTELLSRRCL